MNKGATSANSTAEDPDRHRAKPDLKRLTPVFLIPAQLPPSTPAQFPGEKASKIRACPRPPLIRRAKPHMHQRTPL
jgi:hypothetical protein